MFQASTYLTSVDGMEHEHAYGNTYLYTLYMMNGWLLKTPDIYSSHSNADDADIPPGNGVCHIPVPNTNVAKSVSVTP